MISGVSAELGLLLLLQVTLTDPSISSLILHNVGSSQIQTSPDLSRVWLMYFGVTTPKGDKKGGKGGDDEFWIKTGKESRGRCVP